jgi:GT2 family glycosyltransferase
VLLVAQEGAFVQTAPRSVPQPSVPAAIPRVVAVVLNWNGWLDTIECVESILRSTLRPAQIVICDNGSTDGSVDRLRAWADGTLVPDLGGEGGTSRWSYRPATKPLSYALVAAEAAKSGNGVPYETQLVIITIDENLGYAGGNNVAMDYALNRAGAEFVWLLNNDTVVDTFALERMTALAQRVPRAGLISAKLLQYAKPDRLQAMGGGNFTPAFGYDTQIGSGTRMTESQGGTIELEHVIGACLLARGKAVAEVGPLDETYFLYREETDWSVRMRVQDWKLLCCPAAIVWHKQGKSLGYKSPLHDYYSVRNMLRLVYKYYPSAFPTAVLTIAARSILPKIARLQFRRLRAVFAAFSDFFAKRDGRAHTEAQLLGDRKRR